MFQIFVDSAANLPAVIAKKYNIHVISFVNLILGKEVTCYNPDLSPEEERQKGTEYYNAMREGCEIKTGLISTATFEEEFEKVLQADQDVLYFSLISITSPGLTRYDGIVTVLPLTVTCLWPTICLDSLRVLP